MLLCYGGSGGYLCSHLQECAHKRMPATEQLRDPKLTQCTLEREDGGVGGGGDRERGRKGGTETCASVPSHFIVAATIFIGSRPRIFVMANYRTNSIGTRWPMPTTSEPTALHNSASHEDQNSPTNSPAPPLCLFLTLSLTLLIRCTFCSLLPS
jgi:hypothetical protein